MKITKQSLREIVDRLSDTVDVDELIRLIQLQSKLDRSEQALCEGRTLSHAELVVEVKQWR